MKSLSVAQKAILALVVANVIWGAAAAIFKLSLQNIPLYTLAFWRFFLGALIILAIIRRKAVLSLASKADFVHLILYGLFGITINIIFFFEGLKRTLSINSPIITSGQPILTMIFALIFLHEAFRFKKFFGMILGLLGILIIIFEPLLATGVDGSVIGNLYLVIATVSAVGHTIVGKRVLGKYNPFAFTFWSFLVGAASFLPMMIREFVTMPNLYMSLDWRGVLGIVYGAVFSSAIAYSLYAWGLSKIDATDTSIFAYIDPIVGTVAGALILSEPITTPFILGALLIFGGIFIAEGRFHYHPIKRLVTLGIPPQPPPVPVIEPKPHTHLNKKKILKQIFEK